MRTEGAVSVPPGTQSRWNKADFHN